MAIYREADRPSACFVAVNQEAGDDVLRRTRRQEDSSEIPQQVHFTLCSRTNGAPLHELKA